MMTVVTFYNNQAGFIGRQCHVIFVCWLSWFHSSPSHHFVAFLIYLPVFLCTLRTITTTEIWQLSADSAATGTGEGFSWATFSLLLCRLSAAWRRLVHLTHQVKENLREGKVRKREIVREICTNISFNIHKYCKNTQNAAPRDVKTPSKFDQPKQSNTNNQVGG